MKFVIVLCVAAIISPAIISAKNIVCYFASWSVYRPNNGTFDVENIDPNLCTHFLFAFIGVDVKGHIRIIDPWYSNDHYKGFEKFVKIRDVNPSAKLLISAGGWNENSYNFSIMAADTQMRKQFASEVLDFIEKWKFDGFDIDWNYPTFRNTTHPDTDKQNFVKLLSELQTVLQPKGYLLTAAVSGAIQKIDAAYDVPNISKILDMLNVMVYDFHGHFEPYVGHIAPLYASHLDVDGINGTFNVASGIKYWLTKGADPSKINMGLATYGRCFTLKNSTNANLYAPTKGPGKAGPYTRIRGILAYNEICERYKNWTYYWDSEQQVPHRIGGDQWVGYDDPKSIQLKMEFANSTNLGGVMIWTVDTDDFRGICGEKYPLLNTVRKYL